MLMYFKMAEEKQKKQKRKDVLVEILIPEGIEINLTRDEIIVKKGEKELRRKLSPLVKTSSSENKILLEAKKATKMQKKNLGTLEGHIKNMIKGLGEKFVYKLQICFVHFPVSVSIDKATNEIIIKNFLGERKDRRVKIIEGIDIKIEKEIITIESEDKKRAGQMAANVEKMAKVTEKDRRIFQDGIFIIEKAGRQFL